MSYLVPSFRLPLMASPKLQYATSASLRLIPCPEMQTANKHVNENSGQDVTQMHHLLFLSTPALERSLN